jgi:hypothetical protein
MSDPNQPPAPPTPPAPPASNGPPPPPAAPPAPPAPPAAESSAALASVPGVPIVLTPIDPPAQAPFAPPAPSPFGPGVPDDDGRPKKSRKRWLILAGAAAALLLLGVGAAVAAAVISSSLSPARQVDAFLRHLVDGEAQAALALVDGADYDDSGVLLSDEVYAAADRRISAFTLGDPTVDGEAATVAATITQGDDSYDQVFLLESTGSAFLFWNTWQLAELPLATVDVDFDAPDDLTLEVGGEPLDRELLEGPLPALPGDYAFASPEENPDYTVESARASVVGFGGRVGVDPIASVGVSFPVTLTRDGETAALAAANADLDACVAQSVMAPVGCGFSISPNAGVVDSNIRWSIATRPTATFGAWDGRGFPVVSETPGRIEFSSDISEPSTGRFGTSSASVPGYEFRGTATFVDGVAGYESFYGVIDELQEIIDGAAT